MKKKKVGARARAIKHGYRSGLEESVASFFKRREIHYGYESEKLQYTQPAKDRIYTPDFIISKKDGTKMYIETKGYWPAADRSKMKWILESNPTLDVRMVFMNPNAKISKKSKTTYAAYAEKLGIKWTKFTGFLPQEWLNELGI